MAAFPMLHVVSLMVTRPGLTLMSAVSDGREWWTDCGGSESERRVLRLISPLKSASRSIFHAIRESMELVIA